MSMATYNEPTLVTLTDDTKNWCSHMAMAQEGVSFKSPYKSYLNDALHGTYHCACEYLEWLAPKLVHCQRFFKQLEDKHIIKIGEDHV